MLQVTDLGFFSCSNIVRDNEVRASRMESEQRKLHALELNEAQEASKSALQHDILFGAMKPRNFVAVTSAGAAEEEAQLASLGKELGHSRWWRDGLSSVETALKDPATASRLKAIIDAACSGATANKVAFVRPTLKAAALLLYLQIENAPPPWRSFVHSAQAHTLSAESRLLSRELFRLLGETHKAALPERIEEVQAVLLDKLDAVKDKLNTPHLKASHAALKIRAHNLADMFNPPTLSQLLNRPERDILSKNAAEANRSALLLLRTLRRTVISNMEQD